ncbi:MAG: response regulator [Terriglobales bacterium]
MIVKMDTPVSDRKRILVIDDRPSDSQLVKLALERTNHYVVREENNPQAAVSTAELFRPHLILLDVIMPGLDGGQLTAAFHANPALKDIPIVFLTSTATKQEVDAGRGFVGGFPFVAKPIVLTELIASLEHHLGKPDALPGIAQAG